MKRLWEKAELIDQWTLLPDELAVVNEARVESNKLGLALLLKYLAPSDEKKILQRKGRSSRKTSMLIRGQFRATVVRKERVQEG